MKYTYFFSDYSCLLTRNVLGDELARGILSKLRVASFVVFAETVDGGVHHTYALDSVVASMKLKLWDRGHANQIAFIRPQERQITQVGRDVGWVPKNQSCFDGK